MSFYDFMDILSWIALLVFLSFSAYFYIKEKNKEDN